MPICQKSQYLNKISSNTIYIGRSDSKYSCSDSSCAELGSPMRPVDNIQEAFSVVRKRYTSETPVTLSFSAGSYHLEKSNNGFEVVPANIVGFICLQGKVLLECNLLVQNVENIDIQNIHLHGDLHIIADRNHKGKIQWKNGELHGNYNYITKDNAEQCFTMENVDQYVKSDLKTLYDNTITVTENGNATIIKINCRIESKFKGKINISHSGILNRHTEMCTIVSAGETTDLSGRGLLDDSEKENKTKHVESEKDNQKDYSIINVKEDAKLSWGKINNLHNGEFSDGSFWYNHCSQDNGTIERRSDSCTYKLSGLGGFFSLYGRDKSKFKANINKEYIQSSKNKELRPLFKRIFDNSSSSETIVNDCTLDTPSHFHECVQNGNTTFKNTSNITSYNIGGQHWTNNDKSKRDITENNKRLSCDQEIGYCHRQNINNNSVVSQKISNSEDTLCNNGINSIFELEQNGNSEYQFSEFNNICDYVLKNLKNGDRRPSVINYKVGDSSKINVSTKETTTKVIGGKCCNGFSNIKLTDNSNSSELSLNSNLKMILDDDDAIGIHLEMMNNASSLLSEDNDHTTQTGGKNIKCLVQHDDTNYEINLNMSKLEHLCNEGAKTFDYTLKQNASHNCNLNTVHAQSGGTFFNMITHGNSKAKHRIKSLKTDAKKQHAIRILNDNSVQETIHFNSELSTVNNKLYEIIGNGKADFCLDNCQTNGNILAEKVSNLDIQNTSMKGVLHAVECSKIQSKNCSHAVTNDNTSSPIIIENTSVCNIDSSKIESLDCTPQIITLTDEEKENMTSLCVRGVNFVDCPSGFSSDTTSPCILKKGSGKTFCEVGSCRTGRSEFISIEDGHDSSSLTTCFARNNEFTGVGTNPTVDGTLIEASSSLLVKDGSLISTPEDNCSGTDNQGIITIPMNNTDIPSLTLYYCLALPAYKEQYFVSSSISFQNLIDSYQSKEKNNGIFTTTSTRSITDKNCSPIDGMYITIEGFRTPNDKNALQKDRDGKIIDRNLKDSLYLEKYKITKIDRVTKQTVADIGGSLQYTDGSGSGPTTCIPRLNFPIHYASGEWKHLRDGYIEWNYDNSKETNYIRELRFFMAK